ncbi:hypothetical protein JIN85_18325 [Luteolibacter pohnpeiensis]|uniref:Uncharacterized protein n=1 Tax=Luteolibacter pohnpeiensis TaxID=454153 RepID=A0A934S795_9BACT|nr:hypothetical protein [Luteolibacter pohnpeiensis]MBK1884380.1 hypothetical protein [Luteolibacter pohnpeiensis]
MKSILVPFIAWLGLVAFCHAEEKLETVSKFEIRQLTLPEAIAALNKRIAIEHPGERRLLVAYVESPYPLTPLTPGSGGVLGDGYVPHSRKKLDYGQTKPIAIRHIIDDLAVLSMCHYRVYDGLTVVYGWHEGDLEDPDHAEQTNHAEEDATGNEHSPVPHPRR